MKDPVTKYQEERNEKVVVFNVRIPADLHERLKSVAKSLNEPIAEVVRSGINEIIKFYEKKESSK